MAVEMLSRNLSTRAGERHHELAAPLVDAPTPGERDWRLYEIVREIGRGGTGVVYEVIDQTFGRSGALNTLKERAAADGDTWERFQREALVATRLFHTNIVPVGELHETYLVMRYIEGESLASLVGADPRRSVRLVRGAALAVHYAHGQGVVHRDLKPQNLMVSRDGVRVYVMGFGLATLRGRSELEGDRGRLLGRRGVHPGG